MHPALAARIAASVNGRRSQIIKVRSNVKFAFWLRVLFVFSVVVVVVTILYSRHRERAAFEGARGALFDEWRREVAAITAKERGFVERIASILAAEASRYQGDLVSDELRPSAALAAALARPTLYLRGPTAGLQAANAINRYAMESGKDALLLCLLEPPAETAEKSMLPKARLALAGGPPVNDITRNVSRLADAVVGLPYLMPAWGERIKHAKDNVALLRCERELQKAPLEAAKRASRAEVLIAALDEPNDAGGVTELDGEHAHSVRVVVIDLALGKVLLRLRRQVDPNWVTPNRRSQYARELDSCKLAMEIRKSL
jgi:hypothetical protein